MKKSLLTILWLMIVGYAYAQVITEDSARCYAEQFLTFNVEGSSRRLVKAANKAQLKRVMPKKLADSAVAAPAYYIYNREGQSGFAIIAGDESLPAVIGYSLDNTFDGNSIPDALRAYLKGLEDFVAAQRSKTVVAQRKIGPLEPGTPILGPMLTTSWNQREPYNWLTPNDMQGQHMVTGCVPTAVAQVMYYHRWPANSHSRIYNWDYMLPTYRTDNYNYAQGMAVATLMRDLGAIMGSTYKPDGTSTISNAMSLVPGYVTSDVTSDVKGALAKGPVNVSIEGDLAHQVVADGYDSNGYVHINWGWGGSQDGYYVLSDMSVPYGNKNTYNALRTAYQMRPDREAQILALAAQEGVTVDKQTARVGDKLTMTLHRVVMQSGATAETNLRYAVYQAPQEQYSSFRAKGYYGEEVLFNGQLHANDESPWTILQDGKDFSMTITLGTLSMNGKYLLVPTYCDPENFKYHPFLQYADGTFDEVIPFTYEDGLFTFSEKKIETVKVDLGSVVAATKYHVGGKAVFCQRIANRSTDDFNGKLTLSLTNVANSADVRALDFDLHLIAGESSYMPLTTSLDATGHYRITQAEVWRQLPSGERRSITKATLEGSEFEVLPHDAEACQVTASYSYYIASEYIDGRYCVNDSLYKGELFSAIMSYNAYDNMQTDIDMETWLVPVDGGKPLLIGDERFHLGTTYETYYSNLYTFDIPIGVYRIVPMARQGNDVIRIPSPKVIGGKYLNEDKVTENILTLFDPGISLPRLRIKSYAQNQPFYYGTYYNYLELELENFGTTDFTAYESEALKRAGAGHINISMSDPFRIRKGESGVIFPSIDCYRDYDNGGEETATMCVSVKNNVRTLRIPVEGTITTTFTQKPENYMTVYTTTKFYSKDQPKSTSSSGFTSEGTVQRTLWQGGKKVMTLPTLTTNGKYATSHMMPTAEEAKDIAVGSYIMQCVLTDKDGITHTPVCYPLVMAEKSLNVRVQRAWIEDERYINFDTDIPVHVTLVNNENMPVTTAVRVNPYKSRDNGYLYGDANVYKTITLPANGTVTTTIPFMLTRPDNQSEGCVNADVYICQSTADFSGTLNFCYGITTADMLLPHGDKTVIETPSASPAAPSHPVAYYGIDGRRLSAPIRGFYIIKYSDGTVEKKFSR